MSKISEVYEEIRTLAATVLPEHYELVNPYDIETGNDEATFKQAYGLAFGAGFNTNREMGGKNLTIQREFLFTLSRKIFAGPIRKDEMMAERRSKEKQIFEDQLLIIREFERNTYLQNYLNITSLQYESDSGVEFIKVGQHDLIMLRSIFILEYWQGVN